MNDKYSIEEYKKFPSLKKVNWKSLLYTTDTKLIDLIDKMLQYSPKKRLTPGKALLHEFFDELRNEKAYKELLNKYKNIPELFEFSKGTSIPNHRVTQPLSWIVEGHSKVVLTT